MGSVELEELPASFKSRIWEHFSFPVQYNGDDMRVVDRTKTVCLRCFTMVRHAAGNTSNMLTHIRWHHPDMPIIGARKETCVQQLIPSVFKQPIGMKTDWASKITEAIGIYIASMRPYAVVEEPGFKDLVKVLEPRYSGPSHARAEVEHELFTAQAVALTTDGWISRSTESYLTITAHFITSEWEMISTAKI